MTSLPPCGLYRTRRALGVMPAGRLVYFHNHGQPGPGIYLPSGWLHNRAQWHEHGTPLPDVSWVEYLVPLMPEGLYRVQAAFSCCEKKCHTYQPGLLVQLGYNAEAEPLLFIPEWTKEGLVFPELGDNLAEDALSKLEPLQVAEATDIEPHDVLH